MLGLAFFNPWLSWIYIHLMTMWLVVRIVALFALLTFIIHCAIGHNCHFYGMREQAVMIMTKMIIPPCICCALSETLPATTVFQVPSYWKIHFLPTILKRQRNMLTASTTFSGNCSQPRRVARIRYWVRDPTRRHTCDASHGRAFYSATQRRRCYRILTGSRLTSTVTNPR